jgi:hypothetical protein
MDRTELLRATLGILAFVVAGAQVTMRYRISHDYPVGQVRLRKERTSSIAALLLLTGIGLGNLTHLNAEATTSTVLISLGVIVAAWGLTDLWHWGQEEAEVAAHRHRPTRRGG